MPETINCNIRRDNTMLDEFDMVGRLDEKISSGETSILLQMQDRKSVV